MKVGITRRMIYTEKFVVEVDSIEEANEIANDIEWEGVNQDDEHVHTFVTEILEDDESAN